MNDEQARHEFDEDACCVHCGFDGAEWHHWKYNTYEGRASESVKRLCCTWHGKFLHHKEPRK